MSDAGWAKRAAENLLPLSEEKRDLATAFKEWAYHQGDATDLGADRADCELCDHPDIRYQFGIVNLLNGNSLLVGSECIQKFNIDVLDQEGRPLSAAAARKQLSSDRRKVIANRALQSVITSLLRLGQFAPAVKVDSFIEDYQDRHGFTPRQLDKLLWDLEKAKILHTKPYFKVRLRRDKDQQALLDMEDWRVRRMWECLTSQQRDWYQRNSTKPDR